MRITLAILILLTCHCEPVTCQDIVPTPTIVLPMVPAVVSPDVPPQAVAMIKADEFFVIESDVELIVRQFPTGLIDVESSAGPIRVRGKFSGGSGKIETRDYRQGYIYFLTAISPGTCGLDLVPIGLKNESEIIRHVLTVETAPRPPPDPPGPEPPNPVPTDGNRVLIVYESSELSTLPPDQAVLMTSGNVRDYLQRKCSKGPDGRTPEFRIWDKDVDATNAGQTWKDALAIQRNGLPWLIVSNGTTGFSGPLPDNEAALLAKLKQYLGE